MTWHVYILLSESTGRTYCGITTDIERRLDQHNGLKKGGAKATRGFRPWVLGASHGPYEGRGEAQRIEAQIKKLNGKERLDFKEPTDDPM